MQLSLGAFQIKKLWRSFVKMLQHPMAAKRAPGKKNRADADKYSDKDTLEPDPADLVTLNRLVYLQELMQVAELQRVLLCTLSSKDNDDKIMVIPNAYEQSYFGKLQVSLEHQQRDWVLMLAQIKDTNDLALINTLIHIYYTLSNCYIVTRRMLVKNTIENMAQDISALILYFMKHPVDQKSVLLHLRSMYNDIESLQFSAHRDSRCSRNLFDKSKEARKHFRKACRVNPIAEPFLHELVKPAKVFTIRRK